MASQEVPGQLINTQEYFYPVDKDRNTQVFIYHVDKDKDKKLRFLIRLWFSPLIIIGIKFFTKLNNEVKSYTQINPNICYVVC